MNSGFPIKRFNVTPQTHIQNKQNNMPLKQTHSVEESRAASLLGRLRLPSPQLDPALINVSAIATTQRRWNTGQEQRKSAMGNVMQ